MAEGSVSLVTPAEAAAPVALARQRERRRPGVWRRFLRHRLAIAGVLFVVAMGLAALLAPWLSPYDPTKMNLPAARLTPSLHHPLGTDTLGRDNLTRVFAGGRVSIAVALAAVAISSSVGMLLGVVSGYAGGWVDSLLMRLTDMFMSFPLFVLLIVLVPVLGPSAKNVILMLGLLSWMQVARLVRGQVLSVMTEPYIEAAVSSGASAPRIIARHLLPNAVVPVIVASTLNVANAMLAEAALSFLGLGIQPPTPSWGNMLNAAQQLQVLVQQPWDWLGPGGAIALTVLSINFMGDGLRDALDPRFQR